MKRERGRNWGKEWSEKDDEEEENDGRLGKWRKEEKWAKWINSPNKKWNGWRDLVSNSGLMPDPMKHLE